jgi:hypothetical protein
MKRREFLQKSALVVAGAAAVASGVAVVGYADEGKWTAGLKTLKAHEGETLLKMARQIYPHERLADVYYEKVVADLDAEAAKAPDVAKLLRDGIAALDRFSAKEFARLSSDDQVAALKHIEDSPFFQKVRGSELVSLYNNHEVWKEFGYQGASYPIGGYLHHGFDDLKWLPDPPESASPKPA